MAAAARRVDWGDFGADDQRGRLNLLTPEKVRQGLAEAGEGIVFRLSLPLDRPGGNVLNPRRHPPQLMAARRGAQRSYNYALSQDDPRWSDVVCDDAVLLWTQYSTQWDALCAMSGPSSMPTATASPSRSTITASAPGTTCSVAGEVAADPAPVAGPVQARRLGIENMAAACVQGRAVLIDLLTAFGPARRAVGYEDLMQRRAARKLASSSPATWSACTQASPTRCCGWMASRTSRR